MTDTRPCKGDAYRPAHAVVPWEEACRFCEHYAPDNYLTRYVGGVIGMRQELYGKCLGRDGYLFAKEAGIKLRGM